jgi:hypothetical protein
VGAAAGRAAGRRDAGPCPERAAPAAAPAAAPQPEAASVDQDAPYREACAREGLNESECVGRLIWFKATGGNERFHTYTFQQRVGVLVDWFRVLRATSGTTASGPGASSTTRPAASPASPTARQIG